MSNCLLFKKSLNVTIYHHSIPDVVFRTRLELLQDPIYQGFQKTGDLPRFTLRSEIAFPEHASFLV